MQPLLALVLALSAAPSAFAQTLVWTAPGLPQLTYSTSWTQLELSPDIDGDGRADLLACSFLAGNGLGEVDILSGLDGSSLRTFTGGGALPDNYGSSIAALGDLDGDGHAEIAIASWHGDVHVRSGLDGSLLWSWFVALDNPRLVAVGDVNQDGYDDLAVGWHKAVGSKGRVQVFSGARFITGSGASILLSVEGSQAGGQFGFEIAPIADIDGDGVGELLVGGPHETGALGGVHYYGRTHLLSGANLTPLWISSHPATQSEGYGKTILALPDVSGDGVPDVLIAAAEAPLGGNNTGKVFLKSGADGSDLQTLTGAGPGAFFGSSMALVGDGDADGDFEFLIGSPHGNSGAGDLRLFEGPLLSEVGTLTGTDGVGYARNLTAGRDATGDGLPDFAFANTVPGPPSGPGELELWHFGCPPPASYCIGNPNSVSVEGALIRVDGSLSISQNQNALAAERCVPNQPGVFFYGSTQIQLPFGHGFRCVGGSLFRLDPPVFSDGTGLAQRALDFTSSPLGSGPGQVSPGTPWNFQYWYRDPGAGGAGFNLSNGVNVAFCP